MQKKKIIFAAIFTILGFVALQIPFTKVIGSNTHFTLFDFFAPIAGAFLGGFAGIISVLIMQTANWLLHGASVEVASLIRLFPMLFAVWYFSPSAKSRSSIILPLLCLVMFLAHPIGRLALPYPLYWLIPVVVYFFKEKSLLAKALGATFTAHAVGSVAWLYAFNLPKEVWLSLIPQVALERGIFAIGIAATYIAFVNILDIITKLGKVDLEFVRFNQKLLLRSYLVKK